jgi:hypothetical protein
MPTVNQFIKAVEITMWNTNFQFAGKRISRFQTEFQTVLVLATVILCRTDRLECWTRVDIDARMDTKPATGLKWDGRNLPGLLLPVGIQYKSKCDDQSVLKPPVWDI